MAGASAVGVEAVERAGRRLAVEVHGAAPEAAPRVALAVVEAVAGQRRLGLVQVRGRAFGRGRVEEGEAAAQRDHQARGIRALGHRGDLFVEMPTPARAVVGRASSAMCVRGCRPSRARARAATTARLRPGSAWAGQRQRASPRGRGVEGTGAGAVMDVSGSAVGPLGSLTRRIVSRHIDIGKHEYAYQSICKLQCTSDLETSLNAPAFQKNAVFPSLRDTRGLHHRRR